MNETPRTVIDQLDAINGNPFLETWLLSAASSASSNISSTASSG